MIRKSEPSQQPHEEIFERFWGLHNVRFGSVLQKSGERITVALASKEGKFVYKVSGEWKTRDGVKKDTAVFDALHRLGFHQAPHLVKTVHGGTFIRFNNKYIYVLKWIDGKKLSKTPESYRLLGEAAGRLHKLRKFPFKTDFDPTLIIRDLKKNGRSYPFKKGYTDLLGKLPDFHVFPKSVIHTDIAPSNALRKRSGRIMLVDWDDAGIGPTILDLGSVVNEIVGSELKPAERNLRSFFTSYFSKRRLTSAEIAHIFDAALFFALLYIKTDLKKRWRRIQWLTRQRTYIEMVIKACATISSKTMSREITTSLQTCLPVRSFTSSSAVAKLRRTERRRENVGMLCTEL